MDDRAGADNSVAFLNKIKANAEDKGIAICLEYLKSKVNHRDYMFDYIAWGVDVVRRVNSPRVKILYGRRPASHRQPCDRSAIA